MITIDTNVILRLFIRDEPDQVEATERFLAETRGNVLLYIPVTTLTEFVWMLGRRKFSRRDIVDAIAFIADSPDFVIGHRHAVTQALARYRKGKVDFADYLIEADGALVGAKKLVTFDEAFAREDKKHRKHPRRWKAA